MVTFLLGQLPPDQQATFMTWLMNQGPIAVVLAVVVIGIYWLSRAIGQYLILPARDTFVEYVRGSVQMMEKTGTAMTDMGDHLKTVSRTMTDMSGAVCKLGDTLDCVQQKLTHVDQKTSVIVEEYKGFVDESKDDRIYIHEKLATLEKRIDQIPKMMP